MDVKSVSILYLSIGSGHQVAAESLAAAMRLLAPNVPVSVHDPLSKAIKFLPSFLSGVQATTNLLFPNIYNAAWRYGAVKNTPIENSLRLQSILLDELKRIGPGVIVATHVLPCILATRLKRAGKLKGMKLFGVVTDYGLNPVWPTEGMDGYFTAHEELRQTLAYRGVDPGIVHVTGIPIRSASSRPRLENKSGRLRVLAMAGGIRNGGYIAIQDEIANLLRGLDRLDSSAFEMTVVCGNQPRLEQAFKTLAGNSRHKMQVCGFVRDMNAALAAHDVLFTKPGGLIIAEALASGLPLILSQPSPGVETTNMEFLARHGVAMRGGIVSEIIGSLRACIENPNLVRDMKVAAGKLGRPHAADEASRLILNQVQEETRIEELLPLEYWAETTSAFRES
ncbi:MAG: glycosyltransferase [Chloroflexota bacterium]